MIFLLDFLVPTLDLEFFGFPTLGFHVSLGQVSISIPSVRIGFSFFYSPFTLA